MKIGITGATGFVGARIVELARQRGHAVIGFTRNPAREIPGCEETRIFSPDEKVNIAGCEAIIHLAGEPVFGLWTSGKRRRIRESRVDGTRHLVDAILAAENPPRVLVSGSAIGFYGDTGETEMDESSLPEDSGFLAEVTQSWEAEALRALDKNARVVLLRTSVVLGGNGGALQAMLPAFRAGLGGKLGSGRQWMSWIHLDDEAALALHAMERESIEGPLNAVAPQPCRNADFTRVLAGVLHRPAFFTVPAFVLKTALAISRANCWTANASFPSATPLRDSRIASPRSKPRWRTSSPFRIARNSRACFAIRMEAGTLNCPMCGAPAASDATQCEHCGAKLATIACPSCFSMIFAGSKFCQHCGAKVERTEEGAATGRSCPHCHTTLNAIALGPAHVQECSHCEGLWIDTATFNEICADKEEQAALLGIMPEAPPMPPLEFNLDNVHYIPCPVCATLMNRVNFAHGSGIILDICKAHGVWFDRDELRHIVEFIRAGGLEKSHERDMKQWETEKRAHDIANTPPVTIPGMNMGLPIGSNVENAEAAADFIAFAAKCIWHLL